MSALRSTAAQNTHRVTTHAALYCHTRAPAYYLHSGKCTCMLALARTLSCDTSVGQWQLPSVSSPTGTVMVNYIFGLSPWTINHFMLQLVYCDSSLLVKKTWGRTFLSMPLQSLSQQMLTCMEKNRCHTLRVYANWWNLYNYLYGRVLHCSFI